MKADFKKWFSQACIHWPRAAGKTFLTRQEELINQFAEDYAKKAFNAGQRSVGHTGAPIFTFNEWVNEEDES
jgi:hypothetical protein